MSFLKQALCLIHFSQCYTHNKCSWSKLNKCDKMATLNKARPSLDLTYLLQGTVWTIDICTIISGWLFAQGVCSNAHHLKKKLEGTLLNFLSKFKQYIYKVTFYIPVCTGLSYGYVTSTEPPSKATERLKSCFWIKFSMMALVSGWEALPKKVKSKISNKF